MIIGDDKKRLATVIVAKMGKPGSEMKNESVGEEDAGMHAAAQDFLQAVHDKSPSDLVKAFCALMDCYEPRSEPDEEESYQ